MPSDPPSGPQQARRRRPVLSGLRLGVAGLAVLAWGSAYVPESAGGTPTTGSHAPAAPGPGLPVTADGGASDTRAYPAPSQGADAAAANATARQLAAAVTHPHTPTGAGAHPPAGDDAVPVPLTPGDLGIPAPVLDAYRTAAAAMGREQPGCHLSWPVLAGIGKIESGNAAGRYIAADGTVTPTILGPRLDGTGATAVIRDTDGGAFDHDTAYDHAVGPLQFIPSTWRWAGRSAGHPGAGSPNNIRDAALAAAGYLCRAGNLIDPATLTRAIYSYNPSAAYVHAVLTWAAGYTQANPTTLHTASTTPAGPAAYHPGTAPPTAKVRAITRPTARATRIGSTTSPRPTPPPAKTPAPSSPTPTPTAPVAAPTITCPALTGPVTATGVDTDPTTPGLDTLRITGHLTAPAPTHLAITLTDTTQLPITGATVTTPAGGATPTALADLPGYPIGDAGAPGPYTLTLIPTPTPGCPTTTTTITLTLDPTTYPGWTTTLTRLHDRVTELHTTGDLTTTATETLTAALPPAVHTPTDLAPFRTALAGAHTSGGADPLAANRLTNLADRLAAQTAPPATPTPSPAATPTPG